MAKFGTDPSKGDRASADRRVPYSKSYYPYCTRTKTLLTELGAKFDVVKLDEVADGSEQQDALEDLTGQSTVPNMFVSGKSIGGNSDVRKLHKAGNLEPLLKQSGALQTDA